MKDSYDYKSAWIRWVTLYNSDLSERKKLLESLHPEVRKGFDIVVKIAYEEISTQVKDLKVLKDDIEFGLSSLVFKGYLLFLVTQEIDPFESNLIANEKTNELGNLWMQNYEKDQDRSIIEKIDPIISIVMQNEKDNQFIILLKEHDDISKMPYSSIRLLELFYTWAIHQGFIFGMIENDLSDENKHSYD